jgi:3-oxoacyl-[acyl-carrier protein] reductase
MGKNALITGASGDIGIAIAKQLAKTYNHLYLQYFSNEEQANSLRKELQQLGNDVTLIQADFSKEDGVNNVVENISTSLDLIVHNSGTSLFGLVTDVTDVEAEKFIRMHVTSPFLLTKKLLPAMIAKKTGKIIVISSIWGLTGASCEVLYSMVKGGQNTFVKALAKEVALSGISVNGVAPGAIDTKMLQQFSLEDKEALAEEIPAGRLGTPQEVANVVSFLSSDNSNYINGQILSINGAWHC